MAPNDSIAPSCCNSKSCVSVTSPSEPIAIASVSDALPIVPASGITMFPPDVISDVNATVPAVEGNVIVTSAVDAGPIKVTLLVPLSLSSKNSRNPAEVAPSLTVYQRLRLVLSMSV